MFLRPFLSNQPLVVLLLLPVMALFIILNLTFHYHTPTDVINLGLLGKIAAIPVWLSLTLSALFILGNAVFLNFLFNKHDFLEKNSYAPSLFYVVFMTFSQSFYNFDALLIVHFIFLCIYRLLFVLENGERNGTRIYNIALLFGLIVVLLPQTVVLLPFLWLAVRMNKSISFKEFILLILGTILIVFNGLMFWWFSGHKIGLRILREASNIKYESVVLIASGSVLVIYLLLSSIGVRIRLQKSSIRFKKISRSLLVMVLATLAFGVAELIFYQQVEWFNLVFVPVGFLFTFAFISSFWKQVASGFFYLTFLLAVIKFFIHAGWFN